MHPEINCSDERVGIQVVKMAIATMVETLQLLCLEKDASSIEET